MPLYFSNRKLPALLLRMYLEESELLVIWSLLLSCTLLIFPPANLSRAFAFLSPPWIAAFAYRDKQSRNCC